MCTGAELLLGAQIFGGVAGGLTAIKALTTSAPKQPEVVRTDPVADDTNSRTQAEQEAQAQKIEQRRKLRVNSLLSQAGAAGDTSMASTSGSQATGKLSLGS